MLELRDQAKYYSLTYHESDVANVTPLRTCIHRIYEARRMENLRETLERQGDEIIDCFPSSSKPMVEEMKDLVEIIRKSLDDENCTAFVESIYKLKQNCDCITNFLNGYLPEMKSRIHEFTDSGPGVAVNKNDIKIRICEEVLITNAGRI